MDLTGYRILEFRNHFVLKSPISHESW